jgi:hypothetical protein
MCDLRLCGRFEDVGHSKSAREQLAGLLIGSLKEGEGKRVDSTPTPKKSSGAADGSEPMTSAWLPKLLPALVLLAAVAYKFYFAEQH